MDFSKLLAEQAQPLPTEPTAVYASRADKAKGYGYLRDVQSDVLKEWHLRRNESDLVIKVNTGAGKTIDGLVILQSYLNAGEGPALYVAPDRYLVDQVRAEARRIQIPTTDDPDEARYRNSEVIAVVNASKLFTGRSVFSEKRRSSRGQVPIKSVVIDDAHAALGIMQQHLALTIPRQHVAFDELLALFEADLRSQTPNDFMDIQDAGYGALAPVPFWAWQSRIEDVRTILYKYREDDTVGWAWLAIRDLLELCRAVFTGLELSITPPLPPIHHITSFGEAAHRIYLTATLADDSVLVSDFGADPASVAKPITPATAGDIGERMILAPLELNPALKAEEVRKAVADLARDRNVVVLVPSTNAAKAWRMYTDRIVYADDVESTVESLRANSRLGLVVFVNKYDGIDLPDDACRVLVIEGLPEVQSPEDRIEARLRKSLRLGDDRQIQRIEQGMGRGVRSNEDHCVVLLLGAHLSQLVTDNAARAKFSPATRAQLDLSRAVARGLQDASLTEIIKVVHQALNRDENWVRLARGALANIAPPPGAVSTVAIERRAAFEAAVDHDYALAERHLSAAIAATDDTAEVGWLQEQQAAYINLTDPVRAQTTLVSARQKNRAVLRPLAGIAYTRIPAAAGQAEQLSNYLGERYTSPGDLRLGYQAILDDLEFDPERTDEFEEAMRLLAEHLGFGSQRPDADRREGPDNLWSLGNLNYWVIEVKSGAVTNFIKKDHVNQLSGSLHWFRDNYDATTKPLPVMVHPSTVLARDANAPTDMCVIDVEKLELLKTAVAGFAEALARQGAQVETVNSLLQGHRLRASDLSRYLKRARPS